MLCGWIFLFSLEYIGYHRFQQWTFVNILRMIDMLSESSQNKKVPSAGKDLTRCDMTNYSDPLVPVIHAFSCGLG